MECTGIHVHCDMNDPPFGVTVVMAAISTEAIVNSWPNVPHHIYSRSLDCIFNHHSRNLGFPPSIYRVPRSSLGYPHCQTCPGNPTHLIHTCGLTSALSASHIPGRCDYTCKRERDLVSDKRFQQMSVRIFLVE